jgi:hypothetical protein
VAHRFAEWNDPVEVTRRWPIRKSSNEHYERYQDHTERHARDDGDTSHWTLYTGWGSYQPFRTPKHADLALDTRTELKKPRGRSKNWEWLWRDGAWRKVPR